MSIKHIHPVDQPREKLEKYGGKLSDVELLAIILHTGPKGSNVLRLATALLRDFKGTSLANAGREELKQIRGLGAKVAEILACFELGRRLLRDKKSSLLLSPRQVWEEMKDIRGHKKEHFVTFFLDTQNQVNHREVISVGTLNASLIHPREIFEPAIKYLAANVIISHNHPSGSLEPSAEDLQVTRRLQDAGRSVLGIEVLDHVIVTAEKFFSWKEQNLL